MRVVMIRSHNRRLGLMFLIMIAFGLPAILLLLNHQNILFVYLLFACAVLVEILGFVKILSLAKKQSLKLGFICPSCGGDLYDGRTNRLGNFGECARCKQSTIVQLGQSPSGDSISNQRRLVPANWLAVSNSMPIIGVTLTNSQSGAVFRLQQQ